MLTVYGFPTQNTKKVLYVAEELSIDYQYQFVDLTKGMQKTDDFKAKTPIGKVPLLAHDDRYICESGAIVRYLANIANSPLYPKDNYERAMVDQWIDFFSIHLGRWLSTLFYEQVIRQKFNLGDKNEDIEAEAVKFAEQQFESVDSHLKDKAYLCGEALSIADLFAFAYIEQVDLISVSIDKHIDLKRWFSSIQTRSSIINAQKKLDVSFSLK